MYILKYYLLKMIDKQHENIFKIYQELKLKLPK